jgi:hypothetical protein
MKRFHLLLIGLALCGAVAVGYSDSHVIKKESVQVDTEIMLQASQVVDFSAEIPADVVVDAPDLGRPASNHDGVSEELTGVLKMRIRPPPEKVQKSEYNIKNSV